MVFLDPFLYHGVLFLLSIYLNHILGKKFFIFCLNLVNLLSLANKYVVHTNMTAESANVVTLIQNQ